MSRRVQWPPIQGRGYSVRELMSVGAGIESLLSNPRQPPSPPARPAPVGRPPAGACAEPVEGRAGAARRWSIGAATRALATSVSRPIWLCPQPLHAIAPSQKLVYVEL